MRGLIDERISRYVRDIYFWKGGGYIFRARRFKIDISFRVNVLVTRYCYLTEYDERTNALNRRKTAKKTVGSYILKAATMTHLW